MRIVLAATLVIVGGFLPTRVAAEDDHPPETGCALPKIMVRSVFGPYGTVYHTSGSNAGAQSANGKVRVFELGAVSCRFFRSAPPPKSEALFVILYSYANAVDAAMAFANGLAKEKSVHQDGRVQFSNVPGLVMFRSL